MSEAQKRFINALTSVLGSEYVDPSPHLYICPDFRLNEYMHENVSNVIQQILETFNSNFDFTHARSPKIDCMIKNHPTLGTRIVEFDEEQHFTVFRQLTLSLLGDYIGSPFIENYIEFFNVPDTTIKMLRKARLFQHVSLESAGDIEEFLYSLSKITANNKFIRKTPGFPFVGGRMLQRAYYDLLKDIAHLSVPNLGFENILRFSLFDFELTANQPIMHIEQEALEKILINTLKQ